MIGRNKDGTFLIIELVRRYVHKDIILLKPRMRFTVFLASNILKISAFIISKILCKENGSITTSTQGEIFEGDTERFRYALYNCPPKGGSVYVKFVHVIFDHTTKDLFITKTYSLDVEKTIDYYNKLIEEIEQKQ